MRSQQNLARGIAHDIGEILVVLAERGNALFGVVGIAADDLDRRKRQDALRRLFEGAVEHLVHFVAQHLRGHDRGKCP